MRATFTNEETGPESRLSVPGARRTSAGPIVFVIAFAAVVAIAFVIGRRYIEGPGTDAASAANAEGSERITKLIAQASLGLADGDLDAAKEALDKASVLREGDAAVLRLLATVGVLRA